MAIAPAAAPAIALALSALTAAPAWGHHAMGGAQPQTFAQGLVSGLAHPVIGLDHLAFVVALGLIWAFMRIRSAWLLALMPAAALLGVAAHGSGMPAPGIEGLVAVSVVLVGVILALPGLPNKAMAIGLTALSALHGYVYAESILGAEPAPIAAYLLGLCAIQVLVAWLAYRAGRALAHQPGRIRARCGVAVATIGAGYTTLWLLA